VAQTATYRIRSTTGSVRWIEDTMSPILDESGRTVAVDGVARDITERMQVAETLRASEQRYRTLFEHSPDAIIITSAEGRLLDVNPAAVSMSGYESKQALLRLDFARALYEDPMRHAELIRELNERGSVRELELRMRRADGQRLVVHETATVVHDAALGSVVACHAVLRDVTQQRELEAQLRRSQRLEALGQLAGGVAHDFNNVVMAITVSADLLNLKLQGTSPLRSLVREIQGAGDRAAPSCGSSSPSAGSRFSSHAC
jgi:PAS domain S-box-containing protein